MLARAHRIYIDVSSNLSRKNSPVASTFQYPTKVLLNKKGHMVIIRTSQYVLNRQFDC